MNGKCVPVSLRSPSATLSSLLSSGPPSCSTPPQRETPLVQSYATPPMPAAAAIPSSALCRTSAALGATWLVEFGSFCPLLSTKSSVRRCRRRHLSHFSASSIRRLGAKTARNFGRKQTQKQEQIYLLFILIFMPSI